MRKEGKLRLSSLYLEGQRLDDAWLNPIKTESGLDLLCRDVPYCEGLPTAGCSAFGLQWKLSTTKLYACTRCDKQWVAILSLCLLAGGFFFALSAYAYFTIKYDEAMTRIVSTASILISHVQTMTIVGNLQLVWPPRTSDAFGYLVVDGFNLGAAKPECLTIGEENDFVSQFLTLTRVGTPLAMIVLIISVRLVLRPMALRYVRTKVCARRHREHR